MPDRGNPDPEQLDQSDSRHHSTLGRARGLKRAKHVPTLNDVAKRAGVSRQTVSRYVNGGDSVAPATSQRIEGAIQALHYHPSGVARSLRKRRTMTVGLALYSADDLSMGQSELFALKLSGVLKVLSPRGYGLEIVETDPKASRSRRGTYYLDKIRAGEIDGLIISDFYLPTEDIMALREAEVPFAIIDRLVPEMAGRCTMTNVYLEGFRLTAALIDRGHRKFVYCGWPPGRGLAHRFREGLMHAIAERGDGCEVVAEVHSANEGTYRMLDRLSSAFNGEPTPTAAVCSDDWITGMVALLAERGVPRAKEFQLTGVSHKPDYLDSSRVVLVATPMDRVIGIRGAELLLDLIDGKPERRHAVDVGTARFVAPGFPYLAHPMSPHI